MQVTITAAGWTGSAAPYTQTVAVAGLLANSYGDIGPSNSAIPARAAVRSRVRNGFIGISSFMGFLARLLKL
ncbi:hypothetical protein NE579_16790 [Intestinimonas massiliensis]|uniref:Uncharacterized protein n=1 Tax=Intestinimonas massiliensis (ex Afouda et al. 2020) TaxID=1673721 RepID=A0AAW5JSX2_9FIRM|nr:hypothetical protein [Intestinimonas massiliensis (ex Afouda et al. 2020)]MCQ4772057.1 hypothetical protein [Intestinimonas massiliensis (ex Afouda et al. 2020)]